MEEDTTIDDAIHECEVEQFHVQKLKGAVEHYQKLLNEQQEIYKEKYMTYIKLTTSGYK